MNIERLQLKGMLVEAKKDYKALETEASGSILIIRSLLNPYQKIEKIDTEKALLLVTKLNELSQQLKILKEKIEKLESEFE